MAPLNDVVLPGDGPRRTAFLELRETMCVSGTHRVAICLTPLVLLRGWLLN